MPTRYLLVDDHPLFLSALTVAIQATYPEAELVEAGSIEAALEKISGSEPFDLVMLDLSLPGTTGFEGLLELRNAFPKLPVVVISGHEDPRIIHQAMIHGASGYIPKSVKKDQLEAAIRAVMSGSVTLPADYQPPRQDSADGELAEKLNLLTPQQLRVLKMLRRGLLNKQIAYELGVGETTVKAHVSEILRKFNLASRTQVVIEVSKLDFDQLEGETDELLSKNDDGEGSATSG